MPNRRTLLTSAALAPLLAAPFGATSQAAAQDAVALEKDVPYGEADGQELLLDVYRPPALDMARSAVIVIHGGAWTEGFADRTYIAPFAEKLAEAGYVAFNITYRLMDGTPGHNVWPAQLDDVQRAVRWVRVNAETYGVDPERIASLGHSAGGHLAALLGVRETRDQSDPTAELHSSWVACVVDLSGDMDFAIPYPAEVDNQIARAFLGGTIADVPDAYRDASPITWVDAETVPFLLIHSADDEVNPVAHARTMAAALHEAGIDTVAVEFGRGGHMGPASWAVSGPWVLTFLAVQLQPDR